MMIQDPEADDIITDITSSPSPSIDSSAAQQSILFTSQRRSYSPSFKQYACQTALAWNSTTAAAMALHIPHQTLCNWMHLHGFQPNVRKVKMTGVRPKLSVNTENAIASKIRHLRKHHIRVTMRMMRAIGVMVASERGVYDFVGSKRWLKNFCRRNGFRYVTQRRHPPTRSID